MVYGCSETRFKLMAHHKKQHMPPVLSEANASPPADGEAALAKVHRS